MTRPRSEFGAAQVYRAAATELDEHLAMCPSCSNGVACPDGDETAEREFWAWREWERVDADGTREHRRRGFTW